MEEKYTTSPWLTSPRDEKRVFTLAGFFANEQVTAGEMEKMKIDITKKIKDLGGAVSDSECWDDSITHVVAYVDTRKEGMSEKVRFQPHYNCILQVSRITCRRLRECRKK